MERRVRGNSHARCEPGEKPSDCLTVGYSQVKDVAYLSVRLVEVQY